MNYYAYPKLPFVLGTMVILTKGLPPSKNQLTTACPASWYATTFLSFSFTSFFFSNPAMTLSAAASKSVESTNNLSWRAAYIADSLHKLAKSAPENPKNIKLYIFKLILNNIFFKNLKIKNVLK